MFSQTQTLQQGKAKYTPYINDKSLMMKLIKADNVCKPYYCQLPINFSLALTSLFSLFPKTCYNHINPLLSLVPCLFSQE